MARNVFKDYIEADKRYLREYINLVTEKKINSKIRNMILDTYTNIRYYDACEHVKKTLIDNIEYHVIENYIKLFKEKDNRANIPYIVDSLIIIRYVILLEMSVIGNNKNLQNQVVSYEENIKGKYRDTQVLINDLIKKIKDENRKKEKYINGLLSNDFSVTKRNTNINDVFEIFLNTSIKVPDLYSEVAVSRVYNSDAIYEDRTLVFYFLISREILIDMINGKHSYKYIAAFPASIVTKHNKLLNLLKVIDGDYLRDRVILKVNYKDYLEQKEEFDKLIHEGYSLAVIIDDEFDDNVVLLNVFTYILLDEKADQKKFKKLDNVIYI